MLKDFYGLEKTAAASNPLSLDDEAFNADLFLKKVMAERELPKLVDLDNKTVAGMKALYDRAAGLPLVCRNQGA